MTSPATDRVTLALPSKGAIAEPTTSFLQDCGLRVEKPNPRQYTGSMPALPCVDVLFQRVTDVVYKVSDGTAQLGVTGLDVVREHPHEDLIVVHEICASATASCWSPCRRRGSMSKASST